MSQVQFEVGTGMACLSVAAAQTGRAMILLSGSCHSELSSEVAKSV